MTNPRFVLVSRGSWGDVNPFLGLGVELARRGHRVLLVLNDFYREAVLSIGLPFASCGARAQHEAELVANQVSVLTDRVERLRRWHVPEYRRTYAIIEDLVRQGERPIVVARSWALGARLAQEKLGVDLATVYVCPGESPMLRAAAPLTSPFVPAAISRRLYRRWVEPRLDAAWDPIYGPSLDAVRRELNLPSVRQIRTRWVESPQLALGLWPDWLVPRQPHWGAGLRTTGYVLFDGVPEADLERHERECAELAQDAIVFCPGTYRSRGAEAFFEVAVAAARALARRAILLSEWPDQIPQPLPDGIVAKRYVPLSVLFRRAAIAVHHGGFGTIARAFEAGVPQLVVPVRYDQPFNAEIVRRSGAGEGIAAADWTVDRATALLNRLLSDQRVRANSAALARRVTNGVSGACTALENFAAATSSRPR